ncbi:MAG: bifunctional 2-C-methyl-D-erythritol 4-phosphate cytidylyltransferase/2-C-methyl-D-erythritol 2,4-cyclodiphosphate synthase [Hyphomicrobiales bacterium]|nr:bifunctional 2-C-methyl-D-erythritol 4-phosphate cytidylyltransferase/2-C-methyl-D-erythritol 2,4-cyclodiphosphate synthase [Hyphomicrobiales bacterium]
MGLLVVAGGRGVRLGADRPKQYLSCAGRPLIVHTLEALGASYPFVAVTVVIRPDDQALYDQALAHLKADAATAIGPPAIGGATRQQSVLAGLEALAARDPEIVLIHDAVRPFPSAGLVARAIEAAERHGAAAPGTPMSDTVKQVDVDGRVLATPPRSGLRAVQTPQAFRFALILEAHRRAAAAGVGDLTDDVAVAEWAGAPAYVFEGDPANVKVTTMQDLEAAEARLTPRLGETRVGQGFDVHAFAPGDHVWLCGVRIPHSAALSGHSDADVGLHALADAIYGALAEGDIGHHFPPSDSQWKGAASKVFLAHAAELVRARGGAIVHLDTTLVCEAPKIGPHREMMRARVAEIAGLDIGRVAVKATTSEKLGFTGRGEGIACLATATVRLP